MSVIVRPSSGHRNRRRIDISRLPSEIAWEQVP
jgi:hypothetical protein